MDKKDIRRRNNLKENEIRYAIFEGDLHNANELMNKKINGESKLGVQDFIIKELLIKIFEQEKDFKELLNACVIQKKYSKICKLISERKENHSLSVRDKMIIKLANDLINLNNSNNCDKYLVLETSKNKTLEKAIFGNDFYQALKTRTKKSLKKGKNLSDDIIYLLLYEICNKLDNLKISEEEKIEICFEKIIHYINDNKKSIAKKFVKEYLKLTNNTKYEALLLLYFELMELDPKYNNEFIDIITSINNNTYTFNIANIIGDFYLNLFSKSFNKAKIFLEIIKIGKTLSKEIYDEKLFVDAFNVTIELMSDNKTKEKEYCKQKIEITKKEKSKLVDKQVVKINNEPSIHEREFIENKRLQILEENEIILLKKMNENRYKNIEKILDDIPDITYYYAGRGEDKRMFLKRSYEKIEFIEISEYSNIITEAYNKEDFETALYYLKELLYNGYNNLWIYYRIGIIYFRTCNFDLASDYLTVVNLMNREVNGNFDLTDFVIFIDNVKKGKDNLRNYKPRFKMDLEEFEIDINDYYGIDNFEEINEQILISGLDVETACTNLGLSYEQIDLIKLIYAKLYYYQGEYELGDRFLNSVEHIKDKSINVRNIQNYIRTNRNYYINRMHETDLSFVRRLKP